VIIALLILFTITALGIIAWKSFNQVNENSNHNMSSSILKPIINKDVQMEIGEELHPIEPYRNKVISHPTMQNQNKEFTAVSTIHSHPIPKKEEFKDNTIKHSEIMHPKKEERVIAIIPTPHDSPDNSPITIEVMLQQLEQSETALQINLLKELDNQLSEAETLLQQIKEQFGNAEMLSTLEGQLFKLQQMASSVDPIHNLQAVLCETEKVH